jgi:GT2 family glycosyltransferase
VTDISIILGTYNRFEWLLRCIASIRNSVRERSYEIMITDGGSTDGTQEWLAKQIDCDVYVEPERLGAVAAFNHAYRRSVGNYIMALNDDVEVLGYALSDGAKVLDDNLVVGQLAFAFANQQLTNGEFKCFPMCRHTYANLGMIRRTVVDRVIQIQGGFWNPIYHTYAADTELSCWVWRLGWEVRECNELRCIDHLAQDGLRAHNNSGRNQQDGMRCHTRWPDYRYLSSFGPAPHVESHELEALAAYEYEKKHCQLCRTNRRVQFPCPLHGVWRRGKNRE